MILTVTLNAAVDKTYRVEGFALDRVHRPTEWRIVAGGKGINVARVYRTLGGEALATGFLGGYNGRFIGSSLREEGIPGAFVRTREESRVCIAIVDPLAGTQTELNEAGPSVSAAEARALRRQVARLLRSGAFTCVTLSGSIPPGVPDTVYADLIGLARHAGVRCALDASGEALKAGIAERPWMVKPNVHELSSALDAPVRDAPSALSAARDMAASGIDVVCVTLGRQGAICVAGGRAWQAVPPVVPFISAVGSGDSLLAAFLWALDQGRDAGDALRLGVGAGAANAAVYGAGFCTAAEIQRLAAEAAVCELRDGEVQ